MSKDQKGEKPERDDKIPRDKQDGFVDKNPEGNPTVFKKAEAIPNLKKSTD